MKGHVTSISFTTSHNEGLVGGLGDTGKPVAV